MHIDNTNYIGEPNVAQGFADLHSFFEAKISEVQARILMKTKFWREWASRVKGFGGPSVPGDLFLRVMSHINVFMVRHLSSVKAYAGFTPSRIKEKKRNGPLKSALLQLAFACVGMRPDSFKATKPSPRKTFKLGGYGRLFIREYNRSVEKHKDWTPNHCFLDAAIRTASWIAQHIVQVFYWIYYNKLMTTYAVEKGLEDYMYMPPIDIGTTKPSWWIELRNAMIQEGIRPVEL